MPGNLTRNEIPDINSRQRVKDDGRVNVVLVLSFTLQSYWISSKELVTVDRLYWYFHDFQQNSLPKVFKKTQVPRCKAEVLIWIQTCSKDRTRSQNRTCIVQVGFDIGSMLFNTFINKLDK